MSDLNAKIEEKGAYHPGNAQISVSANKEKFAVIPKTNHNELRIMENDWLMICAKVKQIKIKKRFGMTDAAWGAFIGFLVQAICIYFTEHTLSLLPTIVSGIIVVFSMYLSKKIDAFSDSGEIENGVHLDDLNSIVDRVNNDFKNGKKGQ